MDKRGRTRGRDRKALSQRERTPGSVGEPRVCHRRPGGRRKEGRKEKGEKKEKEEGRTKRKTRKRRENEG